MAALAPVSIEPREQEVGCDLPQAVGLVGHGRDTWVQQPGENNALGKVKLAFPNSENVYLHDTNKPGYFSQARRDFSHGCVRVRGALELASHILEADYTGPGAPFSKRQMMARADDGGTYWYALHEPLPVFLEYYTASVDDEGRVRFHPDIYDYDHRVFRDMNDTLTTAVRGG